MEKRRNKILEIHAGWLWNQGMFEKSMECLEQAKEVRSENKNSLLFFFFFFFYIHK